MAGKNKIERSFRLWWDDSGTGSGTARDLSGDLVPGSVSGGGLTFDEANMHGVSELVVNFLAGHANSTISARFHMNDTSNRATHVLNNSQPSATVAGIGTLTLQWGASGAVPTTGDLEWEGEYVMTQNDIALDGNKFVHQVTWRPTGATAPAWGTVS